MNFFKEAHSAFDFAKHYPLLCKAIADNDAPLHGYTYEEINKISYQSQQHRIHLVDFLLSRLTTLGWSGKQKIIKILFHLCKNGHYEIRLLVRNRDGKLREAASLGGPPDPVLANTPQLFFNSAIQELRSYIFDQRVIKMDEEASQREENCVPPSNVTVGYGSSSVSLGKYDGFGSSPIVKQDSIVDQVFDIVGKVVTPESRKKEEVENFLKEDKGNYQPFQLSNANVPLPTSVPESAVPERPSGPPLYKSTVSPRGKSHVAGKVGGGWGSDDEEPVEEIVIAKISNFPPRAFEEAPPLHERYIQTLLEANQEWPVDYDAFVSKVEESSSYNPFELLKEVIKEMKCFIKEAEFENCSKQSSEDVEVTDIRKCSKSNHNLIILLLFLELSLNKDLLSVNLLTNNLQPFLNDVINYKFLQRPIKLKAKKIYLILKDLSSRV